MIERHATRITATVVVILVAVVAQATIRGCVQPPSQRPNSPCVTAPSDGCDTLLNP